MASSLNVVFQPCWDRTSGFAVSHGLVSTGTPPLLFVGGSSVLALVYLPAFTTSWSSERAASGRQYPASLSQRLGRSPAPLRPVRGELGFQLVEGTEEREPAADTA